MKFVFCRNRVSQISSLRKFKNGSTISWYCPLKVWNMYASSPDGSAAIAGSLTAVVVFVPQWWGEGRGVGSRLVPPFAATPANGALPPAAHGPRLRGTPPPPPLWRPPPLGRLFLAAVVFATRPANYRNCKHLLCFLCTFRRLLQTCSAHWANFLYIKSFMTGKKMSIASKLIRG